MRDDILERLSALTDDALSETDAAEVLQEVARNDPLRTTWSRYHLIRECLSSERPCAAPPKFAAAVLSRIDQEPPILAAPRRNQVFRPALGFAIAASVAAIGVLAVQHLSAPSLSPSGSQVVQGNITPTAVTTQQVALTTPEGSIVTQDWRETPSDSLPRLNSYLLYYNEARSQTGVSGMSPYVRMVGYETQTGP